jgi:hypothetical protein
MRRLHAHLELKNYKKILATLSKSLELINRLPRMPRNATEYDPIPVFVDSFYAVQAGITNKENSPSSWILNYLKIQSSTGQ